MADQSTSRGPSDSPSGAEFAEPAPSIFIADLIDKADCRAILAEFDAEAGWKQAEITSVQPSPGGPVVVSHLDTDRRLARRIHFRDISLSEKPATRTALERVKTHVAVLAAKKFGLKLEEFGDEEIVYYGLGGKFTHHSDANIVKPYRAISILLYLNDDYEGGATSFPGASYSTSVRAGRVLVFPSALLHGGDPVTKGEKYIIVLWAFYPGGR